jgi:hypothetical protein
MIALVFTCRLSGQNIDISQNRHRVRLSLAELSYFYMYTVKVGYEYNFINYRSALETELGYTMYSREDSTKASGYYIGLSFNHYLPGKGRNRIIRKINPYYHRVQMNHYLRYDGNLPGFGTYYDYRKTKYLKERYGISLLFCWQHAFGKGYFTEVSSGAGLVLFRTVVPEGVTQKTFRNGAYNSDLQLVPSFLLTIKAGYAF